MTVQRHRHFDSVFIPFECYCDLINLSTLFPTGQHGHFKQRKHKKVIGIYHQMKYTLFLKCTTFD